MSSFRGESKMKILFLVVFVIFTMVSCKNSTDMNEQNLQDEVGYTSDEIKKLYNVDNNCFKNGIVGGEKVDQSNPRKKHVALIWITTDKGLSICTGSLLSRKTILTAAHCVEGQVSAIQVFFHNSVLCSEGMNKELFYTVNPEKIIIHPQWKSNEQIRNGRAKENANFDLALINLDVNAPAIYEPIDLANREEILSSTTYYQIGYGKTKTIEKKLPELREVARNKQELSYFESSHFIVVDQKNGKGGCLGDSGGPLLIKSKNKFKIAGIAAFLSSFSNDKTICENSELFYGNATDYSEWIKSSQKKLEAIKD